MVKQIIFPLIGVAIFIVVVGMFVKKSSPFNIPGTASPSPTAASSAKSVAINGKTIEIEIANTQALRAKGLSGRSSLDSNAGMFFVFDSKNTYPEFWMKDMLIPLDIIWIGSGKVVKIDKNVQPPAPGTSDSQLTIYSPGTPIDYVLEVNAGFSDGNDLKVGSSVTLPTL